MSGVTSVSGLITGINSDDIITKVLQVARRPIAQLQSRQGILQVRTAALQELNARLQAVKSGLSGLQTATQFQSRIASSTDPDVLDVTASAGAALGQHTVRVDQLARNHQVKSQTFADASNTAVGVGDFTIHVGDKDVVVQVNASNNTLQGLRDAINAKRDGVTASIVQEDDSAFRLVLSSDQSGTAHALSVSHTLAGGTAPTFTDLQGAADASLTLGVGADAITVTRSTNTITDLLPNLSLNLKAADPANPVLVTVGANNSGIQGQVEGFVNAYNEAISFINQQFAFDQEANKNGVLVGDFTTQQIQNDITNIVTGVVEGLGSQVSSFAEVGITIGGDGLLSFDAFEFNNRLTQDPAGVAAVFARTAKTSNQAVSFVSSTSATKGSATGYAVNITQAATKAHLTAGVSFAAGLTNDETLTINGVSFNLHAGDSISEVITAINARTDDTGLVASATGADGTGSGSFLTLTAAKYGSAPKITVLSNQSNQGVDQSTGFGVVTITASAPAGEGGGTGAVGVDVAGTINGEAATGAGQFLTGASGNANTAGLQLNVTAAAAGEYGDVKLFDGLASQLNSLLTDVTDSVDGLIQAQVNSLQESIEELQKTIDTREASLARQEDRMRRQFADLESAVGLLQSQQQQLLAALGSLPGSN